MSQQMRLTDAAIRDALALPADLRAPTGLAESIRAATATVPQRRRPVLPRAASPRVRLALRLALVVGLLVLAAVAALLFAGSRQTTTLPPVTMLTYHGGPERTGNLPGPAPSGQPATAWTSQLKGPVGPASPAVLDGVAYIGDESGFVTALDVATGAQRWQRDVGAAVNSPPTIAGGLVLVGDDSGVLHALDPARQGADAWDVQFTDRIHSSAAVLGGTAFVGDYGGVLKAIDVASGRVLWTQKAAGAISRSIAASGTTVYAGVGGATSSADGTLDALDAATGAIRWSAPLQPGNASTPTVVGGRVFVEGGLDVDGIQPHFAFALDATTGKELWRSAAPSGKTLLPAAVDAQSVYAVCADGNLYALDAATGKAAWQLAVHAGSSANAGLVAGVLYLSAGDNALHAVDLATQAEVWTFKTPGMPQPPAIVDGWIIVATTTGRVEGIVGAGRLGP